MVCPGTASGTSAPGVHADQNELRMSRSRGSVWLLERVTFSPRLFELPGWRWESIHLSRGCCHLCGILMFFCFLYRPNLILLCGNFPPLVSQLIKFLLAAGVIFSRRFDQVEVSVAAMANPLLTLCPSRACSTKACRSQYLQSSKILAC